MNIYLRDDENKISDGINSLMLEASMFLLCNEFNEIEDIESRLDNLILSISIASEDEIKEINNEYRGIDKITDVLSFPQYSSKNQIKEALLENNIDTLLGDVVICYEKACKQAEEYGTGFNREIIYLFVHSLCHLLGYDHINDEDKSVMREVEEKVMEAVGL